MRLLFVLAILTVPSGLRASEADADACAALALAKAARDRGKPVSPPVKVTNGFNCGAGFCGANGGAGCPSCPNGNGVCACGPKAAAVAAPPVTYTLPASNSTCPNGNCPNQATTGYFRRGLFREP